MIKQQVQLLQVSPKKSCEKKEFFSIIKNHNLLLVSRSHTINTVLRNSIIINYFSTGRYTVHGGVRAKRAKNDDR